jgi:hypothetical protein
LGFERNEAGVVETPCGEWIHHTTDYLGNLGYQRIHQALIARINQGLTARDQPPLGQRITKDLTPLEGHGDTDCQAYCDYYQVQGYGLNPVVDRNHGLVLCYELARLTKDEEANLRTSLETLQGLGLAVEHGTLGGYTSFRNVAYPAANNVQATCKITQGWVVHEHATLATLRERYQRYWKHEAFEKNASSGVIEAFLVARGEHALVASMRATRSWPSTRSARMPTGGCTVSATRARTRTIA